MWWCYLDKGRAGAGCMACTPLSVSAWQVSLLSLPKDFTNYSGRATECTLSFSFKISQAVCSSGVRALEAQLTDYGGVNVTFVEVKVRKILKMCQNSTIHSVKNLETLRHYAITKKKR